MLPHWAEHVTNPPVRSLAHKRALAPPLGRALVNPAPASGFCGDVGHRSVLVRCELGKLAPHSEYPLWGLSEDGGANVRYVHLVDPLLDPEIRL